MFRITVFQFLFFCLEYGYGEQNYYIQCLADVQMILHQIYIQFEYINSIDSGFVFAFQNISNSINVNKICATHAL